VPMVFAAASLFCFWNMLKNQVISSIGIVDTMLTLHLQAELISC